MKKKIIIILIIVAVIFIGATTLFLVNNAIKAKQSSSQLKVLGSVVSSEKGIFVYSPYNDMDIEQGVQIKGITKYDHLKIEIYDDNNKLLNTEDKTMSVFSNNKLVEEKTLGIAKDNWYQFNKLLSLTSQSSIINGHVIIYYEDGTTKKDTVTIPIHFIKRFNNDQYVSIISPIEKSITNSKTLTILGYSMLNDKNIDYIIKDKVGKVWFNGSIKSTNSYPYIGMFSKEIDFAGVNNGEFILELSGIAPLKSNKYTVSVSFTVKNN